MLYLFIFAFIMRFGLERWIHKHHIFHTIKQKMGLVIMVVRTAIITNMTERIITVEIKEKCIIVLNIWYKRFPFTFNRALKCPVHEGEHTMIKQELQQPSVISATSQTLKLLPFDKDHINNINMILNIQGKWRKKTALSDYRLLTESRQRNQTCWISRQRKRSTAPCWPLRREQKGPGRSRQPGHIVAGMILYQAVAVQRDKQRRIKHRTKRIKVPLGKQEKCRRDETGEEKKRRLSLPFSISPYLPFSLSRRGENFLQKPGWYPLHPSRPAELGTKPRTYEKSNHLSLFSFIFRQKVAN